MNIISAIATHNQADAHLAYDADPSTRWTTGVPMQSGMSFNIELDGPAMISGIHLTAPTPSDDPPSWVVAVMASSGGHGYVEVARGTGPVVATWEPVRGQWVKITCLGKSDEYWWSISDIAVTAEPAEVGPEPPPVVPPVVPPEPPPYNPDYDPMNYTEARARAWVQEWAQKFPEWGLYHEERKSMDGALLKVTAHILFPLVRTRVLEDGTRITESWPWAE